MNNIISGRTNPNVRHTIRGIYLCEKLNKHLKEKIKRKKTNQHTNQHTNQLEEIYEIEVVIDSDEEKIPLLKEKKISRLK